MAASEKLTLTYDGQLAAQGQMLLYEYGRSQYAFSRIITTVEQYRRRKIVLQKIAPSSRVKLKVRAPEKGSFKLEVDIDTSPDAAVGTADFDVLFAVVLDRLIPGAEEFSEIAATLARIKVAEWNGVGVDQDFNDQAKERIREVAIGAPCSSDLLLKLLLWAKNTLNRAVARSGISQEEIERAEQITISDIERKSVISKGRVNLDADEINRLTARIRPMFKELAVPLGESADVIWIGSPKDKAKFYSFDRVRLNLIDSRVLDERETELSIKIKSFDVESGNGSMRIHGEPGVKYFSLDPATRNKVQQKTISAMAYDKVSVVCAVYTDSNGVVTSYLLRDVEDF